MKHHARRWLVVIISAAAPRAADLYVGGSRPGAYVSLQDALDAAAPGDRILIESGLSGSAACAVVRKSVTIEGGSLGTCGAGPALEIAALTPGVSLVLRRLFVTRGGCYATPTGLIHGAVTGDIVIDSCSIGDSDFGNEQVPLCVDLGATTLWVRNSTIAVRDRLSNSACIDTYGFSGGSALAFAGQRLIVEDSALQGASAAYLFRGQCSEEYPYGGIGGFALRANTRSTVLVRTQIIDGIGSDIQNWNWRTMPQPGGHLSSFLVGTGGVFQAYSTTWQYGRDGQLGFGGRLPPAPVGIPDSRLTIGGTGQIGSTIEISFSVDANEIAIVPLSLGWIDGAWTPAGPIWIDPSSIFLTLMFANSATVRLDVPNDPWLTRTPVILQGCSIGVFSFSNPVGVAFRL